MNDAPDNKLTCRVCGDTSIIVLDLGDSPPANALRRSPDQPETSFPLVLQRCETCGNVQLQDCLDHEELYKDYLYVTPNSTMLAEHYQHIYDFLKARDYLARHAAVLEVGSNIGLFLKFLKERVGPTLGIDPAVEICRLANESGIETVCDFFSRESAARLKERPFHPDVIFFRHCFAHNCDPHAMIEGVKEVLPENGLVVIENAYLLSTIQNNEFDQIYHEHMFYYSIRSMKHLLQMHGLSLIDIHISQIHGGSIVFIAQWHNGRRPVNDAVTQYAQQEEPIFLKESFDLFSANAYRTRDQLRAMVTSLKASGFTLYTYGATAKGNTLLNFAGLTHKEIACCVDSTPIKQGRFLPKSNIRIISEAEAFASPPDYFLLTAWNYKEEIISKVNRECNYRPKFIIPVPSVHII